MRTSKSKSEMYFGAYGPFIIGRQGKPVNRDDIRVFWEKIKKKHKKLNLQDGIGIYVATIPIGRSKALHPVYIGKTDSSFKKRLTPRHHMFVLHAEDEKKYNPRRLHIFLLARMNSEVEGDFKRSSHKKNVSETANERLVELNSIKHLEFLLIGKSIDAGFDLFNSKHKAFHRNLKVAGLHETSAGDARAAEQLAKIFKTR